MPAFVVSLARQGLCFVPFILLLPALYGEKGLVAAQSAADIVAFVITISAAAARAQAFKG
jgi:Na+-driven multidrug efflux pump